jgi:hypothetical protein
VQLQTAGCEVELVASGQQSRPTSRLPVTAICRSELPTMRASDGDLLAAAIDLG